MGEVVALGDQVSSLCTNDSWEIILPAQDTFSHRKTRKQSLFKFVVVKVSRRRMDLVF